MKINRMATEQQAPEWIFASKTKEYFEKETLSSNQVDQILNMSCNISDDEIVSERDKIEKCASSKTPYLYNVKWPDSVKSDLKEYASVCGMDMSKFKAVDPASMIDKITVVNKEASSSKMTKTASAVPLLSDPFKIDEKIANSFEKSKWHPELKGEAKLADRPTMSGIVPVRGGEDYFANSESKTAKGQNSITDPNAIGKLVDSQDEDTGARLKRQNEEKEASKKTNHEEWQNEKIAAMEHKDILPNRHVFPTECMNAQPGIKGNVFDFDSVPTLTDGEKLKTANEDRKKSIRGEEKQKYEFSAEKASVRGISDSFAEALKKHLSK